MITKQTILIFGTGNTSKVIAACFAAGNFHVLICDKDHSKAETLVKELKDTHHSCDIEAMQCSFESAWEADIIILTMHFDEQEEVAGIIKEVVNQKILISAVHTGTENLPGQPAAECQLKSLQKLLPNTKIVMICNDDTITDPSFIEKANSAFWLAGSDDKAVGLVSGILESVGINPIRKKLLSSTTSLANPSL